MMQSQTDSEFMIVVVGGKKELYSFAHPKAATAGDLKPYSISRSPADAQNILDIVSNDLQTSS